MISIADGIGLLIAIVAIATIADRLRIAYPILLVIVGIGVALIPIHHRVQLQPELVLLVFLPPLIYDASLDTSARELRTHLQPILLLAVGLVLATMVAVAVVIHSMVSGMPWAVAFALGAIVSPPDSVAATQIAGKLGLPRRLVTILGGEGMMNDATALTAYQVAVARSGPSSRVADVFGRFPFAVVVGVAIGIAVGWVGCRMLRLTETPVIENTMLLILPFAAYLPADKVGASGVLAVVATGLYFGRYGSRSLTAAARLQQREIWDLIVFLLTGLSFLLGRAGAPAHPRQPGQPGVGFAGPRGDGRGGRRHRGAHGMDVRRHRAARRAAAVRGQPSGRTRSWRETTVVGWAGMRGAVSLAAALALPQSFPQRDLLVFLTFAVIVATLVGQGLTLPPLIRRLGLVTRDEQDMVLVAEAPPAADGAGTVPHRRPEPMAPVPRRGGRSHPQRVPVPAGPDRPPARGAEPAASGEDDSGRGRGPSRSACTATCRPSSSSASWSSPGAGRARPVVGPAEGHRPGGRGVRAALDVDETTMRP